MDRAAFLEEIRRHGSDAEVDIAERVFEWAEEHALADHWNQNPSAHGNEYTPAIKGVEWEPVPFGMSTRAARVWITGENLVRHHPFRMEHRWGEILERLGAIRGVVIPPKGFYPHIRLTELADVDTFNEFFDAVDSIVSQVRRSAEKGLR
jgi:hypothetical protein